MQQRLAEQQKQANESAIKDNLTIAGDEMFELRVAANDGRTSFALRDHLQLALFTTHTPCKYTSHWTLGYLGTYRRSN